MMSYTKKSFALVSLLLISCYSQSNDRTENNPNTQANISSVSQTHDLDLQLRGNLEFAKKHQIQYHYKPFNIQNEQYMVGVYSKQPINNNVRYLILHDNENASFDSGLHTIANGGLMIVLENNEQRYLFDQNSQETTTVDHNRIFKPSGKYYALAKYILEHLDLKPNT
ncbi:MAG: hypothetical protein Q4D05_03470, partial [Acinetobacter sp.]|nr:hypothetical protein [Acinetobacter sp.]